jgi:hypothetical protein
MKHIKLYEDFSGDEWLPNGLTLTLINPKKDEHGFIAKIARITEDDIMRLFEEHGYFYVIQQGFNKGMLIGQIFNEDDEDGETLEKPKLLFLATNGIESTYTEIMDPQDSKEMILDAVALYGDEINEFLELIKTQYPAYYPGDAEIERVRNSDYSRMSREELEELLDQAVEEGDYKKADEINRYLNPDSFGED